MQWAFVPIIERYCRSLAAPCGALCRYLPFPYLTKRGPRAAVGCYHGPMTDFPDAQGPDAAPIPPETREALLATLAGYEHLLFESMGQADYDALRAPYADWVERLGDSPEAIAICDALDDLIDANVEEGDAERAYFDLVIAVQQGGK